MSAPGKNMIMAAGIIYVVFGALGMIGGIVIVLGASLMSLSADALLGILALVLGIVAVLVGIVNIILGIYGVIASGNPLRSQGIIVVGYVLAGLQVISFIINMAVSFSLGSGVSVIDVGGVSVDPQSPIQSVIGLIIGLVLPVLYIIGGRKNRDSLV